MSMHSSPTSSSNEKIFESKVRLIWHRRDLRLTDNELYSDLVYLDNNKHDSGDNTDSPTSSSTKGVSSTSISLFIFDQKYFHPQPSTTTTTNNNKSKDTTYSTIWCGPHAAQAQIEAVTSLRSTLQSIGGELLVRVGDPSIIIPQVVKEVGATEIYFHEEPGSYEQRIVQKLKEHYIYSLYDFDYYECSPGGEHDDNDEYQENESSAPRRVSLVSKHGYTLYHPDDLPTDPNEWNRLAHPKQKHQQRNKRKKKKHNTSTSNQNRDLMNNGNDLLQLIDVSPERFKGICRIMGDFRKACRSAASVRRPIPTPTRLMKPDIVSSMEEDYIGSIPTLEELMTPLLDQSAAKSNSILGIPHKTIELIVQSAIDTRNQKQTNGQPLRGEKAALNRLNEFIDDGYAVTADRSRADVSNNHSSRFSIHLALGTLSPRSIYWKAHDYTSSITTDTAAENQGAKWIMSHLEMRDFFLYTTYAAGKCIFRQEGLPLGKNKQSIVWNSPQAESDRWCRWATGTTQLPMVDAAMTELMRTGYCSNRVRQNVASCLTKDLKIDWRAGAEWFQFLLEDHCVGANYGNWLYFSGVGPDPKSRHFRTVSQLKRYDSSGAYIKKWIPVLSDQDIESTFRPWDHNIDGFDSPIVDPKSQYTWQDLQFLKQNGKLMNEEEGIY